MLYLKHYFALNWLNAGYLRALNITQLPQFRYHLVKVKLAELTILSCFFLICSWHEITKGIWRLGLERLLRPHWLLLMQRYPWRGFLFCWSSWCVNHNLCDGMIQFIVELLLQRWNDAKLSHSQLRLLPFSCSCCVLINLFIEDFLFLSIYL